MNPVKIAVIGAGNWGRNHVRTIAGLPGAHLAAVCDLDAGRRADLARHYGSVLVTDSIEAALDAADGVVVATPAADHAPIALECLRRGLPVLVEKPMTLTVAEAEQVVGLSAETGVPVLAGHLLLFHPAVERLKAMVQGGELGRVYYLYGQRVNLGQVRPDENALWSFGPHDISITTFLLGRYPVKVAARGRGYLQPGVEDVVFFTMEFDRGEIVHIQLSWLDPHKERRLTVVGSDKMVVFDDMQSREKLKVFDKGVNYPPDYGSFGESLSIREGDIWLPRIESREPLRAELEHFISVVRRTEQPRASARDGLSVVRVLEAATRSLASDGETVALPEELHT